LRQALYRLANVSGGKRAQVKKYQFIECFGVENNLISSQWNDYCLFNLKLQLLPEAF
jgi:hypothetical protein